MAEDSQEACGLAYFEALDAAREASAYKEAKVAYERAYEASAEAAAKAAFDAAEAAYQEAK